MTDERIATEEQWMRVSVKDPAPRRRLPGEREPRREREATDERTEADLVGTWFARLGALAILIGAGFAFKYAIDRGWVSPEARVVIGMVAGAAFLGWGEWATRRGWSAFAAAVTGGGIGLLYLSILAGFHLYAMYEATVAFGMLTAVAAGSVALALRHDAQPLATVAAVGAFLNPFLIGVERILPEGLLGYVLIVDLGVLALAAAKRWQSLDAIALSATWLITALASIDGPAMAILAFGGAFFALFNARTLLHAARGSIRTEDLTFVLPSTILYLGIGASVLDGDIAAWQGRFVIAMALGHLLLAAFAMQVAREDLLARTHVALAVALAALAIPLSLDGPVVGVAWTGQAVVLLWIGRAADDRAARGAGAALLAWAVSYSFVIDVGAGLSYAPERLVFSGESAALVLQVVALAAAAVTLRGDPDDWEGVAGRAAAGAAHLLAIAWMLFEARAGFLRLAPDALGARRFAYTAIVGLYGGALMAIGVLARIRGARYFALWLLAVTVVKLVLFDVWMLEVAYRTLAFIGLGVVLLVLSVMYQRLREIVTGGGA